MPVFEVRGDQSFVGNYRPGRTLEEALQNPTSAVATLNRVFRQKGKRAAMELIEEIPEEVLPSILMNLS